MRLGIIARSDNSGLGAQTRRLTRLLSPDLVMLIDSKVFNGSQQHPELYESYNTYYQNGFPTDDQVREFLSSVDVVISCETFYNNNFTQVAKEMGKKTILIVNWEFFDWLRPNWNVPLPDKIISPSYWHFDELKSKYKATYLPTPIFKDEFDEAFKINTKRTGKKRYLFFNGKSAAEDRNGLKSLYEALHVAKGDFEVVVKSQGGATQHPDPRLTYDNSDPIEQWKMYAGYDAMILPRRYAGQCLPMCEALMSALPVIMTDISPNNMILPKEWLVPAVETGSLMTRTSIPVYSAIPRQLAYTLDNFVPDPLSKLQAREIGMKFEAENLRDKYTKVIEEIMI